MAQERPRGALGRKPRAGRRGDGSQRHGWRRRHGLSGAVPISALLPSGSPTAVFADAGTIACSPAAQRMGQSLAIRPTYGASTQDGGAQPMLPTHLPAARRPPRRSTGHIHGGGDACASRLAERSARGLRRPDGGSGRSSCAERSAGLAVWPAQ